MTFRALYSQGFVRAAACTLRASLADPRANAAAIVEAARSCHDQGVVVAVFPELCLSAYAIDDLLLQDAVQETVQAALTEVAEATREMLPLLLIGAPLRHGGRLYNCAVALHRGRVLGVVPKQYLPNYREFYEHRHFASGLTALGGSIRLDGADVPFGTDLLFAAEDCTGLIVHAEICEDLWVPIAPSSQAALSGATVLANLSASNIVIGKAATRSLLCRSQSALCLAAYLYAAAGAGESTTDLAWDGQACIYENGTLLAETQRFPRGSQMAVADIDLDLLRQERARQGTFDDNRAAHAKTFRTIGFRLDPPRTDIGLRRTVERFPFVPANAEQLAQDCYEAYNIQVAGLSQRLQATGITRVVIGVSGGLDSTQALIVAARCCDLLDLPRTNILAYTLPGFATGANSKSQAWALMRALGVSARELDIRPAATQMLTDLGHPAAHGEPRYDTTYENVQAGLRTDYLFRLANLQNALVLGTGDLSELALGWCTYGVGDQMSHYNVNAGVPKTLIQHLIRWSAATQQLGTGVEQTLRTILDAEISPELIPGETSQSTEAKIGPYVLQDFNLFYTLRYGFRPSKIAFLALHAWESVDSGAWPTNFPPARRTAYTLEEITAWLRVFIERFFGLSQFKRSAMPNGPKVVAGGSLSPRGDWRAPSDGVATAWLEELEKTVLF